MATDLKERALEFIEDYRVIRRLSIWGPIILFFVFIMFGPYKLLSVNGATMGPELRGYERYVATKGRTVCVGDYVHFQRPENDTTAIRSVIALSGQTFVVSDAGYRLDGTSVEMSETWIAAAQETMGGNAEIVISEGQILVRRTDPDQAAADAYEAFLLVSEDDTLGVLSRVVLSTTPTRLGRNLRSGSSDCTLGEG